MQVGGDRDQVGVRLGGEGQAEPFVELVEVQPPLARRLPQHLGHPVAVGVRDPHPARVPRDPRPLQLTHAGSLPRPPGRRRPSCRAEILWTASAAPSAPDQEVSGPRRFRRWHECASPARPPARAPPRPRRRAPRAPPPRRLALPAHPRPRDRRLPHHRLQAVLRTAAPLLGHPRAPRRGHGRRRRPTFHDLWLAATSPPTPTPAPPPPGSPDAPTSSPPYDATSSPAPASSSSRGGGHRQDHAGHGRRAGQRHLRRHRPLPAAVDPGPADAAGRRAARRSTTPRTRRWWDDALARCPPYVRGALALLLPELGPPPTQTDDFARQRLFASIASAIAALADVRSARDAARGPALGRLEHPRRARAPVGPRPVGAGAGDVPDRRSRRPARPTLDRLARLRLVAGPRCLNLAPLDRRAHPGAAEPGPGSRARTGARRRHPRPHPRPPALHRAAGHRRSGDARRSASPACSTTGSAGSDRTAGRVARALGVADRALLPTRLGEASGLALDRVLTVLHQLSDQWLLAPPDGTPAVGLRHPLIAEAIRRRLAPGEAGTQHRRVAEALATRRGRRAGRDRAALARRR